MANKYKSNPPKPKQEYHGWRIAFGIFFVILAISGLAYAYTLIEWDNVGEKLFNPYGFLSEEELKTVRPMRTATAVAKGILAQEARGERKLLCEVAYTLYVEGDRSFKVASQVKEHCEEFFGDSLKIEVQ